MSSLFYLSLSRGYNFVSQHDFYWFFISFFFNLHAYCFAGGEVQIPFCCSWIQLVGHSLQYSRSYSLASFCNVYCQMICKEWSIHSIFSHSHLNPSYTNQFSDKLHHSSCIPMFSSYSSVFFLLTLSYHIKENCCWFFLNPSKIFVVIF